MKTIPLTRGMFAIVDDADYELVSGFKWQAVLSKPVWYARTTACEYNGKQRMTLMHRFLMGDVPGVAWDHKNGNGLDNRRSNIRLATATENAQNRAKPNIPRTSGYKGVGRVKRKTPWVAHIRIDGTLVRLGGFDDEISAAKAYDAAARRAFGIFARTNFQCV